MFLNFQYQLLRLRNVEELVVTSVPQTSPPQSTYALKRIPLDLRFSLALQLLGPPAVFGTVASRLIRHLRSIAAIWILPSIKSSIRCCLPRSKAQPSLMQNMASIAIVTPRLASDSPQMESLSLVIIRWYGCMHDSTVPLDLRPTLSGVYSVPRNSNLLSSARKLK